MQGEKNAEFPTLAGHESLTLETTAVIYSAHCDPVLNTEAAPAITTQPAVNVRAVAVMQHCSMCAL